ncbi:hypothetical protein BO71DRAFT_487731 [Aspergillus ellipticus CBS 707.79]|uniref:AB hydrolase-1 domain-containing protein n=1 Tax=Aspergillus ellipticus CBS 707.79 TaxID=1448320 RepID=A0A319CYN6_9EURO|nr:hypothetical protein BO71DRAFT_487731 [Aspergillus ellipticus CBS 707.79]
MSTTNFTLTEHIIPGCHIREYPGSTRTQEAVLQLHVKQYTPKNQAQPIPSDAVTIIATHGAALPKELYEPLWDTLHTQSTTQPHPQHPPFTLRSIWIADFTSMGTSGILNEPHLSTTDSPSWHDHSRDLLLLINHFRSQMPPIGGTIITNLAYLHPRLFTTILLLDPIIQLSPPDMGFGSDPPGNPNFSLWRDDVWPDRDAAVHASRQLLTSWDPRCVQRMTEFAFRELPTRVYPVSPFPITDGSEDGEGDKGGKVPVTLTTTKYHDLLAQIRANFHSRDEDGRIRVLRDTHADLDPLAAGIPLYRAEGRSTFLKLEGLGPACLWVLGERTFFETG